MKVAALDLGTNTFLCLIAEVVDGKILKVYSDEVQVVRLGQGVAATKKFHQDALDRARSCLIDFGKRINIEKPDKILAFATSAAREVENADELFRIGEELGIPIEIIPGAREAEITYAGALSGFRDLEETYLVLDIGGGSTEFIIGEGQKIISGESLNIGCVRLTESFIKTEPITDKDLSLLTKYIQEQILTLIARFGKNQCIDSILAVAGTPTELARVEIGGIYDVKKIDGFEFTIESLKIWRDRFCQNTTQEIINRYKISPGRADVILAGVIILIETCSIFCKTKIVVSTRGVRHGVALEIEKRN
jgi:exopolyphosphatase/guanosine-5'-triphosphate,3'-diphosphate pyrophosphatase